MKETMLTYINESPSIMMQNIKNRKNLTQSLVNLYEKQKCKTFWIVACGSSYNASMCAKSFMMKYMDCHIKIVTPNTFIYEDHRLDDNDIVVVVSQSGCSTNSIEALKKVKELNHIAVGVTGNVDSDFKDYADILIDYGVGEESVGYVTKGVVTLTLFFMVFALEASLKTGYLYRDKYNELIEELEKCPCRNDRMKDIAIEFYNNYKKEMTSMSVAYFCGFMQGYGICQEAALKVGETVKIPSFAYEAEEYIHGPNLQLTPNYTVFLVDDMGEGSQRIVQIYKATRKITDKAYIITNNKDVDDEYAIRLPFDSYIREPLFMPLYVLPVFQYIAYKATDDLNKWQKHPLYSEFKKEVNSKTENIYKVMKNYG